MLYIVGQFKNHTEDGVVWEFQGVYDSIDKAEKACIKETFFVGPAELNEEITSEKISWEGCYYPLLEERK